MCWCWVRKVLRRFVWCVVLLFVGKVFGCGLGGKLWLGIGEDGCMKVGVGVVLWEC